MTARGAREFFEQLPERVGADRAADLGASYRFDLEGAGSFHLSVEEGRVVVREEEAPADCIVRTSEDVFLEIVHGERNPVTAYLTGKVKVEGDVGLLLALKDTLGP
jgi:putative sterol carrier protein